MSFCCAKALALTQEVEDVVDGGNGDCQAPLAGAHCLGLDPLADDLGFRVLVRWPDKEALELLALSSRILPIYYQFFSQ